MALHGRGVVRRETAFTRHGLKSGTAVPHSKTLSRGPAIPAMPHGLGLSGGTPDRATEDGRAPLQETGITATRRRLQSALTSAQSKGRMNIKGSRRSPLPLLINPRTEREGTAGLLTPAPVRNRTMPLLRSFGLFWVVATNMTLLRSLRPQLTVRFRTANGITPAPTRLKRP